MDVLKTLKGFRDFLPITAGRRIWLRNKLQDLFSSWGFLPLESPTLEYAELFEGQIGEDEKLFFRFTDQGDRKVALRYDQTVPSCRIVAQYQNEIKFPFKRYQIQTAFRAEKPQKGRYREFLQADCDIFGVASPLADAECIALSLEIYKSLGFTNYQVRINDRNLFTGFPYEAVVSIDKLGKIGKDGVIADMIKKGITKQSAEGFLNKIEKMEPNDNLKTIFSYLKGLGYKSDQYYFDSTIARSFAYSSGPIWEVVIPEYSSGSVLGGERYDNLIEKLSGKKIPATGFAVGFDRTYEALDSLGLIPKIENPTQILVALFDEKTIADSLDLANRLRSNNITVEIFPSVEKLGRQLKYADEKNIPYVALLGSEEKSKKVYKLKNMAAGREVEISLNDLPNIK